MNIIIINTIFDTTTTNTNTNIYIYISLCLSKSLLYPLGILGGHLNIRSLISKRDQISVLLMDSNLDYLCLTESWLQSNIPTNMIDIAGYQCFRKDRTVGKGGGVLIYIKYTFNCHKVELKTPLECLALNVILSPTMNFNIVVLYNPPSHNITA